LQGDRSARAQSAQLEQVLLLVDEADQVAAGDRAASHQQAGLTGIPGEEFVVHPFAGRNGMPLCVVFCTRSASETQSHE